MLRITIEDVPEPQAIQVAHAHTPARRADDYLYPTAMTDPKTIYQQSWVDGQPRPDVTKVIGWLNDLDLPEACAACGHPKAEHSSDGEGECLHRHESQVHPDRCRCIIYMTKMQKWNQGVLKAHDEAVKKVHELENQIALMQEDVLLKQIEKVLPEIVAKAAELSKPKRKSRTR